MMRKYLRLIAINLGVLFCLIIFLELGIRIFAKDINLAGTSSDIFEENRFETTLGFLPNVEGFSFGKKIKTDDKGFLKLGCTNYNKEKKSILFIGDSVTQGVGVDQDSTFVGMLSCHFQKKYNIINASLIGYDFSDYRNVVKTILDEGELDIKHVVFNFCLNDIYDKGTTNPRGGNKKLFGKFFTFLKSNSYFYIWLKATIADRSKAYFLHDFGLYQKKEKVDNFSKITNDVHELCEAKEVNWSVVVFPYEYQMRNKRDEYYFPQKKIKTIFEEKSIPVFSPLEYLLSEIGNRKSEIGNRKSERFVFVRGWSPFFKSGSSIFI